MSAPSELKGPDFVRGIAETELTDGVALLGHAEGEAVLLTRRGGEIFAVGATCTHYGGPLAEGLIDGDKVHCPYHHACFSLRTGEALQAPALNPIPCYEVDKRDGRLFVLGKSTTRATLPGASSLRPASVVILGG